MSKIIWSLMRRNLASDLCEVDIEEFIKMLKETNSIIAGSYPMAVCVGRTFNPSDIDIFTKGDKMREYLDEIFEEKSSKEHETYYKCSDFIKTKVYEYQAKNIKIQLIDVFDKLPLEGVVDKFDLDFCKVFFDGDNTYVNEAFLNRTCEYDLTKTPSQKTHERIIKYAARGFVVTNEDAVIDKLNTE